MTCSAVSVSAVSRVMKSMKDWKVTVPCPLGSTKVIMRANSASPWGQVTKVLISSGNSQHFHFLTFPCWHANLYLPSISLESLKLTPFKGTKCILYEMYFIRQWSGTKHRTLYIQGSVLPYSCILFPCHQMFLNVFKSCQRFPNVRNFLWPIWLQDLHKKCCLFWGLPSSTQGLFLTLCSKISLGGAYGVPEISPGSAMCKVCAQWVQ